MATPKVSSKSAPKLTSKSSKNAPKHAPKQLLIVCGLILLLLAAVIGYKVYDHHRQQNRQFKIDQANFTQAEKDMATAYARVVQQVGQPYETQIDKSCAHANLELIKGGLNCGLSYDFSYEELDSRAANSKSSGILMAIPEAQQFKANGEQVQELTTNPSQLTIALHGIRTLNCALHYNLSSSNVYNSGLASTNLFNKKSSAPYVATYVFECGSKVSRAIYSIE